MAESFMRPVPELHNKKKSQLEFLAQKQAYTYYKKGQGCSFITLTYDDATVPLVKDENGNIHYTLKKKNVQNYLKRLRATKKYYHDETEFKVIYCGEYGENYGRPHAHMALLGLTDSQAAAYTEKEWQQGIADYGTLGNGGIRYIIDYMQKTQFSQVDKLINEALNIENPYLIHSTGLAKEWLIENEEEIINNKFYINGQLLAKPACEFIAHRNGIDYKKIIIDAIKNKWHNDENWEDLELEASLLREKWLIEGLRSKGQQISQWQLKERFWAKPRSYRQQKNWKPLIEKLL